jgi:uncharacterized protein (UPF0276 family)
MAGIGLKAQHQAEIVERRPVLDFLEIHAENYMGDGGPPHRWLGRVAELYPLSVHGVGLGLGSDQPLDLDHLDRLAAIVQRYQPLLVSEHLSWSGIDELYLNDLLPLPYDEHSLGLVADHVDQVQSRLKRQILLENPSSYIAWQGASLAEPQFLAELTRLTGCGILLDVNNIYVSHCNVGLPIAGYFDSLPQDAIGEIHLAGHHVRDIGGHDLRLDDHGSAVCPAVWQLYQQAVARFGAIPTLIERDSNIPPLQDLLEETAIARQIQHSMRAFDVAAAR